MSAKTLDQLRAQASQIEEATQRGENTQLRVGGMFTDIINLIGEIPYTAVELGPFLKALKNSKYLQGEIDPEDGVVLSFLGDDWGTSGALTALKVTVNGISSTVTSNWNSWIRDKQLIDNSITNITNTLGEYVTKWGDLDLSFSSYRIQNDQYIAQWAVARDSEGNLVSASEVYQTAFETKTTVTDNKEAADEAFKKIYEVAGLDYDDKEQESSASWLYSNKKGITGAAANFDENGNILNGSVLSVTIDEINSKVTGVEGTYSQVLQMYNQVTTKVEAIDGTVASLDLTVVKKDSGGYISNARLKADNIEFEFTKLTNFKSGGTNVMTIDNEGNLSITGFFSGKLKDTLEIGRGVKKLYLEPTLTGARLIGKEDDDVRVILGFDNYGGGTIIPQLYLNAGNTYTRLQTGGLAITTKDSSTTYWVSNLEDRGLEFVRHYQPDATAWSTVTWEMRVSDNRKMYIGCSDGIDWLSESEAPYGYVYKTSDGVLKVKQ